ncbi:MAG: hydantoinase/oxoprolinase family protein [Desulfobulbaceae bacterium]|nr:hydantoinase/oxoprolinase family protein [Desulfobulbaceae bacterium]
MKKYIIGIDTGGTYTDAVLIEADSGKVIATAKEPTTHYHLATGTGKVLAALLTTSGVTAADIGQLAVSTTLATNAVVEKKGARVGLFVIGYVKHFPLPVLAVVFIKGGHTLQGVEEEPLDLENLVDTVRGLTGEVDAYAVCSAMSMANPTHELVAEKAIAMLDPKPVFCSHRISQQAGMRERAATSALHAKLMPLMQDYIAGVQAAMVKQGLSCPVVIIGGNGQTVTIDHAVQRAGMTVASGPACTAHFGALQTTGDALVIDVGGTTTDIAIIENGRPVMAADGCQIGEWQTHVEAIDMFTGGIGGDSLVLLDEREGLLRLGPGRVVPLCMAQGLPPASTWLGAGGHGRCIGLVVGADGDEASDDPVLQFLGQHGPSTPATIGAAIGISAVPLEKHLEGLARMQLTFEAGFTPTDALHVLGRIALGSADAAKEGAAILAAIQGVDPEQFCHGVCRRVEKQIEDLIIDYIIHRYWGTSLTSFITSRESHPVLGVAFSLKIPLIGIGAAARYFLPGVAARLGTTVSFSSHCEVGNAIGAALLGRAANVLASIRPEFS